MRGVFFAALGCGSVVPRLVACMAAREPAPGCLEAPLWVSPQDSLSHACSLLCLHWELELDVLLPSWLQENEMQNATAAPGRFAHRAKPCSPR